MKESQAVGIVAMLSSAFPRQEVTQQTIETYVRDLVDLDAAAGLAACEALRKTARFFPTIAEVREMVARLTLGAPEPMAAWEQAGAPGPRHELVDRARRMVGDAWHWRETPAHFLRRPFLEAYDEALRQATLEIAAPTLARALSPQLEEGRRGLPPEEPTEAELVEMPRDTLERFARRAEPKDL